MVVRVTADLESPPTDEEVDAVHNKMLGKVMSGTDGWRNAVRVAIQEFQALRQAQARGGPSDQ